MDAVSSYTVGIENAGRELFGETEKIYAMLFLSYRCL